MSAAQQQLLQAEKLAAVIERAGAAADELGQPLAAPVEQARRVRQQALTPEVKQELDLITVQVQAMAQIVDQMRHITRYDDAQRFPDHVRVIDRPRAASST